jgi:hypothetical protein
MHDDTGTGRANPDRVELAWVYRPVDFFEVAYEYAHPHFQVSVDDGRAVAVLTTPEEPVVPALQQQILDCLVGIFLARQLQVHRGFDLGAPTILVHRGDGITTAEGFTIAGTSAEPIAQHAATLDLLAAKVTRGSVLRRMLESYSRAVEDPDNEWVHLYEIRDALATHYTSHRKARAALGITQDEWDRVGVLAVVEPILQGRHRGHQGDLRPATPEELADVRQIVRGWIKTFAQHVREDRETV